MTSRPGSGRAALFRLDERSSADEALVDVPPQVSVAPGGRALPGIVRPADDRWPAPPGDAAYCGLAGEIVQAIAPTSEADPVALLVQLLVGIGSLIGAGPHYRVGATRHRTNEFVVLVGPSGSGRKGSSWDPIEAVLAAVDAGFVAHRIAGGLSSGEGLIWHVRDGQRNEAADRRLCVLEPELASVLKASSRESNTLSPVLRNAWDGRVLQVITKHDPARASAAHVSIIGHITEAELRRHVSEVEMANGFLNRFLLVAVRRVRLLPEGGEPDEAALSPLTARLRLAVTNARATGHLRFDEAARALWWETYPHLSAGRPGLLGAVCGRAEAHVVRLALLYALIDGESAIGLCHLRAALALWDYAAASAAFVFGDSLGDRTADEIWRAITRHDGRITRSEIRDLFDRNKTKVEIDAALGLLESSGRVDRSVITGRGRPSEVWTSREASR